MPLPLLEGNDYDEIRIFNKWRSEFSCDTIDLLNKFRSQSNFEQKFKEGWELKKETENPIWRVLKKPFTRFK